MGRYSQLFEYANQTALPTHENPRGQPLDTLLEWRLSDGRSVSMLDAETFQIVQTDMIIRKIR